VKGGASGAVAGADPAGAPDSDARRRFARALLVWRRPALWDASHLPWLWGALERRAAALEREAPGRGHRAELIAGLADRLRSVLRGDRAHLVAVARDLSKAHVHDDRDGRHVGALDAAASFLWSLWAEDALRPVHGLPMPPRGGRVEAGRDAAEVAALALARLIAELALAPDRLPPAAVAGARAALPLLLGAHGPAGGTAWFDHPEGVADSVYRLARHRPAARDAPALGEAGHGGGRVDDRPPAAALVVAPGAGDALKRLGGHDRHRLEPFKSLARPLQLPAVPAREAGEAALRALRSEMPNFGAAVERARLELALLRHLGAPSLRLRPLLLVGPPGVGKTRFARRLAASLGLAHGAFSLAGASDNRALEGTSAGWSTAAPSWPVSEIERLGTAGPLLLVDKVDKTRADGRNGDPLQTLLDWLEPGAARAVRDPVLGAPVDLSRVSWLLCANDAGGLPGPLLSRLGAVRVEEPPPDAFLAVLRGVLANLAAEFGARPAALPALGEAEMAWLERRWRRDRTPRLLRRLAERLLARAAERPRPAGTPLN